jgi:PhnB protein
MTTAATGQHTTAGRPHGFSSLTPFIAVHPAQEAIDFYGQVFGARVVSLTRFGEVIVHAELDFGRGRLQLGEPTTASHLMEQSTDEGSFSMGIYVEDADATVARAVAAGAMIREPLTDFVSGDRFASIRDPFGVRWSVMTRVEDLSDDESASRVAAWAASFGSGSSD